VARHRSPRGRRAHPDSPVPHRAEPLVRRAAAARPLLESVPVRRGAAAVAVTGGAFSLMGAGAPVDVPPVAVPAVADAAAVAQLPALDAPAADGPALVMMPAVTPVAPEPDVLDDPSPLVKAVQMGEELAARLEAERVAAEERARAEAERAAAEAAAAAAEAERRASVGADCGIDTGQLGAVKGFVREAARFLGCAHDVDTMHGVAGRAGTSDHPSGLAVDFMIGRTAGDALADCALQNMDALGIKYVIWEQRINHGDGWELMEDRGGVTANHFDHVHISFDQDGGGELSGC
jgi:hypothetical protein